MKRRSVLQTAALISGTALSGRAKAQAQDGLPAYPNRPVRLVVPWPPGQATDLAARVLAQALTLTLRQPVMIENKAGAGGMIGTDHVAKSAPDGYALLAGSSGPVTVNPMLRRTPYDPDTEFAAVAMFGNSCNVLAVRPDFPAFTAPEFIEVVRASPGRYTYASSGAGATAHLIAETFNQRAGLSTVHVPFSGSAAGITAAAAGQVDFTMETLGAVQPLMRSGRIRALGVSLLRRSTLVPDLAPFSSLPGFDGFDMGAWIGLLVPAATPAAVVGRLAEATAAAMQSGDLRERIGGVGIEPDYRAPVDFARHMKGQREAFAQVVRNARIQLD